MFKVISKIQAGCPPEQSVLPRTVNLLIISKRVISKRELLVREKRMLQPNIYSMHFYKRALD